MQLRKLRENVGDNNSLKIEKTFIMEGSIYSFSLRTQL